MNKNLPKFWFLPDYLSTANGNKVFVSAEDLRVAYGIPPYLVATEDEISKAIWLAPRWSGDYKEHLQERLKARGYS